MSCFAIRQGGLSKISWTAENSSGDMRLVVEAGATKSDWRIIGGAFSGEERHLFPGINVSSMPMARNIETVETALRALGNPRPESLFMYVAGIVTEDVKRSLVPVLQELTGAEEIEVRDDMVAAARAVCGREPGIVAILGTGSNTCFWDGTEAVSKVRSGGFIIGDEGGGAALGKLFLADFIKDLVPGPVAADFAENFDASYEAIVRNVYRGPAPSGYLGSIAPFLLARYEDPYVKSLVDGNFRAFVQRSLKRYETDKYPVGIAGGFGWACRDIIKRICMEEGVSVGCFESEPVNALVKYHSL